MDVAGADSGSYPSHHLETRSVWRRIGKDVKNAKCKRSAQGRTFAGSVVLGHELAMGGGETRDKIRKYMARMRRITAWSHGYNTVKGLARVVHMHLQGSENSCLICNECVASNGSNIDLDEMCLDSVA